MTTEGRRGLITRGREVNARQEDRQMKVLSPLVIHPAICEKVHSRKPSNAWGCSQKASHACSSLFVCLQYIVCLLRPPLTVSQLGSALRYYIFIIRPTLGAIHQQVMTMITIGGSGSYVWIVIIVITLELSSPPHPLLVFR